MILCCQLLPTPGCQAIVKLQVELEEVLARLGKVLDYALSHPEISEEFKT